ncbi:MAG: DoxX family protein [Ktedonobacteraceae bacterium]|nr:DoxX family protein [Ktedonobacteraceae bacterium]
MTLGLGLLILRVVAGLTIAAHGAQKLFGWFGGSGFTQTVNMQERMNFKPPLLWALLVILGEFGGGLSLACGFLTPLGAAGIFGAMLMAMLKVHWKNGFFSSKGGFEFPLLLMGVAVGIGIAGPGDYALDTLLGIALPTPLLFIILAVVALLVDIVGLIISRPAPAATGAAT